MISFTATIERFSNNKEKTGWYYIIISKKISEALNPGVRLSYRVKGKIDKYAISQAALLPVKGGLFMLPFNAAMRKATGKQEGEKVNVQIVIDKKLLQISDEFVGCLQDEPQAYAFFQQLAPSHQRYFSKWIETAKTTETKVKRITMSVMALSKGKGFGEMLRESKKVN